MGSIVDWMRLARIHTAILETPLAFLGAVLGLGTVFDPQVIVWTLFGVMYHAVGYGMNSYVDWKKGYDKEDEQKQHHPLNTGDIDPEIAEYAVYLGLGLLLIYAIVAIPLRLDATLALIVMVSSGVAYNYYSKETILKPIPISLAHTMVFVLPYISVGGEFNLIFWLLAAGFFIHHLFQIGVSGDVKDISQDEANVLKQFGASLENIEDKRVMFSPGVPLQLTSYILTIAEISIAVVVITVIIGGLAVESFIVLLLGALTFYYTDGVIESGEYNRTDRVSNMSKKELTSIWMLCGSTIPVIGLFTWAGIVIASILYLAVTSKIMWGTLLTPKV